MATSYRPDEDGSRKDRPSGEGAADTGPAADPYTTRDAETRVDRGDAPTRSERIRDDAGTGTTAGTAATPAPVAGADDSTATRPITARDGNQEHPDRDARLRAEAAEVRRDAAASLGVARTRNRGTTDFGLLVLRLMNVVLFLHGLAKATNYSGFRQTVAGNSVGALAPDLFAILVMVGELALPIAIAVGLLTRIAGLLQAIMMAVLWVLFPLAGGLINPQTGGINGEGEYLFVAIGLTLFFTGAGRMSIDQAIFGKAAERRAVRRAEKKLA